MTQLTLWLGASLLVVSGFVYLALRLWRQTSTAREESAQTAKLHLATMEALALAIEAKDHTAHNHIRRVQIYSAGLARALGMPAVEVKAIETAALLHDIGKLAVPEHILAK